MKTYTQEDSEYLFWKVYRNCYLNNEIFSNIYKSEIYIDSLNMKYVPEIPKLNNINFKTGSGYCNWLINNLMNDQYSNKDIKELIKKEGLDKFSFLNQFRIESFTIDNYIEKVKVTKLCDDGETEYYQDEWLQVKYLKDIELSVFDENQLLENEIPQVLKSINIIKIEQLNNLKSFKNLKSIKIRELKELNKDYISSFFNINSINCGEYYDNQLQVENLSNTITNLNLGWRFNQEIKRDQIPSNIKSINIGETYNHSFTKETFGNSIKTLEIGSNFDKYESLINISESIKTIVFGDNYFRALDNSFKLPHSIKTLVFSKQFNSIIPDGVLNNNGALENLILGESFAQPLTINNVPSSVKYLKIPNKAQQFISQDIFNKFFSLESVLNNRGNHLEIGEAFNKYYFINGNKKLIIPSIIKSLTLNNDTYLKNHNIPKTIKYLTFGNDFINSDGLNNQDQLESNNSTIDKRYFIKARDIPKNTTHLSIQSPYVVLDFLPSHITHFKTSKNYNQQVNILKNNNNLKCLNIKLSNINYIIHDELKPFQ